MGGGAERCHHASVVTLTDHDPPEPDLGIELRLRREVDAGHAGVVIERPEPFVGRALG